MKAEAEIRLNESNRHNFEIPRTHDEKHYISCLFSRLCYIGVAKQQLMIEQMR